MTTGLGMSLVSALGTFKTGMVAAALTVYTDHETYVTSGEPSQDVLGELVSIGSVTIGQDVATVGDNRGREETLTCEVMISVFRGGDDDQQTGVDQRAAELLTLLEQQVHYTDTTLGGAVRHCFLTSATLDSGPGGMVDNSRGRMAVIEATFTAKARITR